MTTNINLTIGERLASLKILDSFKGSITELASVLEDVKRLVVTSAEWEAANRVITKNADGESWKWDENEKTNKGIELLPETIAYLTKTINDKSTKGEVTIADASLVSLQSKLIPTK
jgi:hypothetical protein